MISTVDDVARFYRALLDGRLLPPAQQRELLAAIPVNDTSRGELFAEHYGLGIYSVQLSCGTAWGHDGGINGTLQSATGTPSLPETGMVCVAPPAGFEPAHPPPEGGALSPELRGLQDGERVSAPGHTMDRRGHSLATPWACCRGN